MKCSLGGFNSSQETMLSSKGSTAGSQQMEVEKQLNVEVPKVSKDTPKPGLVVQHSPPD